MVAQPLLLLAGAALVAAAPAPSGTTTSPRPTHTVAVGWPYMFPANTIAEVGSIVEFHFAQTYHAVAEAAFDAPCVPKNATSFYSGTFWAPNWFNSWYPNQANDVFQIEIRDTNPIWYYCSQDNHCQEGEVGVINQQAGSAQTLDAFRAAAAKVPGPSRGQAQIQGGQRIPNPNPHTPLQYFLGGAARGELLWKVMTVLTRV